MRKRRLKILLIILLTPIILLCVFLLFERIRGQISLARYKRELISKGEKLTFQELIPPTPEGENGAPELLAATQRLPKNPVLRDSPPPAMELTPSGHAVVGFRESVWVEDKVTNNWDGIVAELKTNESTLAEIRTLLEKPILNNNLDFSQGFKMPIAELSTAKSLTFWFGAQSQLALHEGKNHEALEYLISQTHIARWLVEDRIWISELVRIGIAAISKPATWEALQADSWSNEDLEKLQAAWQNLDFATAMVHGLEGERTTALVSWKQMRQSNEDTYYAFYFSFSNDEESDKSWWDSIAGFFKKQVYCRVWRFAWSHQGELHYLRGMQRLLEIARAATVSKSYARAQSDLDQFDSDFYARTFYDKLRLRLPSQFLVSVAGGLKRAMRAETDRSITVCAIALKRYSIRHERFPASLDALVPEFLSSVPIDYMDGKPMKFHLNADGSSTLYSVGEDGKDDGGDVSLPPNRYGYRNLWERKDFIWPAPATSEEVEAWRIEAAKN